jgi:hypothetical protein
MFVKPAAGLMVPDPERQNCLPADGDDVPDTEYWRRRLSDGDVIAAKTPRATKGQE